MVTGGWYGTGLASVEVLSGAGTPISCTIPPLPTARRHHTHDGLLSCGGADTTDTLRTCAKLSALAGGWVVSHNLRESRFDHSSWQSPAGLVIIGGEYSGTTTELLSSSDSSSSSNFTLQYDTE